MYFSTCYLKASSDRWDSDLYQLIHALGHCFTYNPPEDGLPDFEGGIGLFLGRKDSNYDDLHNIKIFIHERGQFWPNHRLPELIAFKQNLYQHTKFHFQAVKYHKVTD